MRLTIDLNININDEAMHLLRQMNAKLDHITTKENIIMAEIDDLNAAVAAEKTVQDSAITLLGGLSAQLTAALQSSTPNVAVQAVVDQINANKDALAAAVTANTPAAPG